MFKKMGELADLLARVIANGGLQEERIVAQQQQFAELFQRLKNPPPVTTTESNCFATATNC